mgnify:CR=1 FL=1
MRKKINITLFPKQIECFKALEDNQYSEILFGGGAGGAKTFTGCLWQITRRLKYPKTRGVIGRAKLKNLKQTTLNTFFEVCHDVLGLVRDVDYEYNAMSDTIVFPNQSLIYLKDLFYYPSDPDYTKLGGLEITDAFIDECGDVHEKAITILNSRIRYKLDEYNLTPKTLLTCNPSKNWLYTEFYKPEINGTLKPHRKFIKSLVSDNKAISRHYVNQLEKLDKVSRQRLLMGNWEYAEDDLLLCQYDDLQDLFLNSHIETIGTKYISADIARFGADKTAIILWDGMIVEKIIIKKHNSITQTITDIQELAQLNSVQRSKIIIDEDGMGGGIVDGLSGCKGFVNNSRALRSENYQNLKTQCYYKLAEYIGAGKIYIADDRFKNQIIEEFEVLKRSNADKDNQRLQIEGKETIKAKLGRSPDIADAIMMRMWYEVKGSFGDYALI